MVPAVVVVIAIAVVLAISQVVLAVVADQIGQSEAVVGGQEGDRAAHRSRLASEQIRITRKPLAEGPDTTVVALPEAAQIIAEATVPARDPPGREVRHAVEPAAVPGLAHHLEITQLRVGLHRFEQRWRLQGGQLFTAAEGDAQIKAEAVDAQLHGPAAQRFQNQVPHQGTVGGDAVAAATDIQIITAAVLVVIEGITEAPPAEGGTGLAALGGVVVHHVEQHLQPGAVTGRHQLAHFVAALQRVGADQIARMGCHPAQGAVTPVVQTTGGRILRIKGHHRQQFDRRDPQLLQSWQHLDQAQQGALTVWTDTAAGTVGKATDMQFINDTFMPAMARPGGAGEIKAIPLGHHPLEAAGGIGHGPDRRSPLVDLPAGDRPGAGVEQHFGRIEAVAAALQGTKGPVAIAAADADAFHLHMPVVAGAVLQIQLNHLLRFAGLTIREQQQIKPCGQGGDDRKVDAGGGGRGPQWPGVSDPDRRHEARERFHSR